MFQGNTDPYEDNKTVEASNGCERFCAEEGPQGSCLTL
jgi:hypothetical protein